MKLPDWLFDRLEPLVLDEQRRRRARAKAALEEQDRRTRAYYDRLIARHRAGVCGGAEAGCCYVPCVPRVE